MKRALLVLWVGVACGDPTQSGHVDVEVLDTIEEHVTHTINPGDRTGRAPPASCTPPRLSVPVYSLVTEAPLDGRRLHCAGACFNMNIMSYVTPVAHAPEHWYAVSLYHGTESRENFLTNHGGLLQILAPSHAPLVPLLGKTSAKDGVEKLVEARKLGFGTTTVKGWPVLESAIGALLVEIVGEPQTCGDHDVVMCRMVWYEPLDHGEPPLTTGMLRQQGILPPGLAEVLEEAAQAAAEENHEAAEAANIVEGMIDMPMKVISHDALPDDAVGMDVETEAPWMQGILPWEALQENSEHEGYVDDDEDWVPFFDEWQDRFGKWWGALPIPSQAKLGGCMSALGLSLASAFDLKMHLFRLGRVSGMVSAAPPPIKSETRAASECDAVTKSAMQELPDFPTFPMQFENGGKQPLFAPPSMIPSFVPRLIPRSMGWGPLPELSWGRTEGAPTLAMLARANHGAGSATNRMIASMPNRNRAVDATAADTGGKAAEARGKAADAAGGGAHTFRAASVGVGYSLLGGASGAIGTLVLFVCAQRRIRKYETTRRISIRSASPAADLAAGPAAGPAAGSAVMSH